MLKRRRPLIHLLWLALLIAQLGMAAHAYSHLKNDFDGGVPSQVQSCVQCLSFTPLLGMVGSSHGVGVPEHVGNDPVVPAATMAVAIAPSWPAFRSRAPPVLL